MTVGTICLVGTCEMDGCIFLGRNINLPCQCMRIHTCVERCMWKLSSQRVGLHQLSIYCFSTTHHPFCLLCEDGSGPCKYFPLPAGQMSNFVRRCWRDITEGKEFSFSFWVVPLAGSCSMCSVPSVHILQCMVASSFANNHSSVLECGFAAEWEISPWRAFLCTAEGRSQESSREWISSSSDVIQWPTVVPSSIRV